MAVVAINALNAELPQALAGQSRQIGQPFPGLQGLKKVFCAAVLITKSRHHLGAHFEGLRPNAWPQPHQDVFCTGLTDR
jgi:hypothetical protein